MTISQYSGNEEEPARGPLRKPVLQNQARGAPSVPGPYVCFPTGVFPVTSRPKARIGFLPPLRGYKYNPLHTPLFPLPRQPGRGRGCRSAPAVSARPSEHPRSRRRGPLASRGRTPFPPPLLAQKGVLSHVGGVGGKEAPRGRWGAVPSNPFYQPGPSTC